MFSLVFGKTSGQVGRIALWLSREHANREAVSSHILSLRSRLRFLSLNPEERLLDVKSGHMPQGFASLQASAKLPAYFPSSARQSAVPAV